MLRNKKKVIHTKPRGICFEEKKINKIYKIFGCVYIHPALFHFQHV